MRDQSILTVQRMHGQVCSHSAPCEGLTSHDIFIQFRKTEAKQFSHMHKIAVTPGTKTDFSGYSFPACKTVRERTERLDSPWVLYM